MKFTKTLTLTVLVLLALLLSAFTYAYWNSGLIKAAATTGEHTISIGSASNTDLETTIDINLGASSALPLVPNGFEEANVSTNEVFQTFEVFWTGKGAEGAIGNLETTFKEHTLAAGMNPEDADLFNVEVLNENETITAGSKDPVTVTVKFTLNEPKDKAQYERIHSKEIQSSFSLKITPATGE